jgi:hypothetical protein
MVVPSLSWQNDRVYIKWRAKDAMRCLTCAAVGAVGGLIVRRLPTLRLLNTTTVSVMMLFSTFRMSAPSLSY